MTSHPSSSLQGRVAVITGGARGIGLALSLTLAEHGASIALLDQLDAVASSADLVTEKTGRDALGIRCDVTNEASVAEAFDAIVQRLGTPSVLVNAAGITSNSPALTTSIAEWERIFSVNVTGTFIPSQTFARHHVDSGQEIASIINVSSMSAFAVNLPQTQTAYNASKAAVSMLTKSVAVEWLPVGIRVNAIAPGYIASDMTRDFVAENQEMAAEWVERTPIGRMGRPEELGELVAYLAGESSSYLVGQSIVIDGGYTLV